MSLIEAKVFEDPGMYGTVWEKRGYLRVDGQSFEFDDLAPADYVKIFAKKIGRYGAASAANGICGANTGALSDSVCISIEDAYYVLISVNGVIRRYPIDKFRLDLAIAIRDLAFSDVLWKYSGRAINEPQNIFMALRTKYLNVKDLLDPPQMVAAITALRMICAT